MRVANIVKVLMPVWLVAGLVMANCTMSENMGADQWTENGEDVSPACDPDGMAPCPDDWFICVDDGLGGKLCEGQNDAVPDDAGDWTCIEQGTSLICEGDHIPGDSGDWYCEDNGDGTVTCRTHAYVPNVDGGASGTWDCYYEEDHRICEYTPGGDDGGDADSDSDTDGDIDGGGADGCPPGVEMPSDELCDDGIDNDCDGAVDEDCGGPPPDDCLCIPGAWRYCDTPTYCRWGIQHCAEDSLEWGTCNEITAIPTACVHIDGWYSPAAEACCVEQGLCCQDMWDLDHDGDTWESLGDCTDILCV